MRSTASNHFSIEHDRYRSEPNRVRVEHTRYRCELPRVRTKHNRVPAGSTRDRPITGLDEPDMVVFPANPPVFRANRTVIDPITTVIGANTGLFRRNTVVIAFPAMRPAPGADRSCRKRNLRVTDPPCRDAPPGATSSVMRTGVAMPWRPNLR
jgi:hypothetical protein